MRPLVILRPEPGASATAEAARGRGLDPVVAPLFEVRPLEWEAPDAAGYDALLLTSANAVRHAGAGLGGLAGLPAYCVGDVTAKAARDAGLSVAGVGESGVDALVDSIASSSRLLHLSGIHRRAPANARQRIDVVPVYEAVALPLPDALRERPDGVIAVHSPRAASRLREFAETGALNPSAFELAAISAQVVEACGEGWQAIEIASEPTDAALLAIAARLCNNSG